MKNLKTQFPLTRCFLFPTGCRGETGSGGMSLGKTAAAKPASRHAFCRNKGPEIHSEIWMQLICDTEVGEYLGLLVT